MDKAIEAAAKLTERETDLISALIQFEKNFGAQWARVMDLGGTDASWHSGALRRLAAKGLCEATRWSGYYRKVYRYRANEATRKNYRSPQARAALSALEVQ